MRLFLCGDVMIGRGVDQVMRRSVEPQLHEPHVRSAETYVDLAVRANGPIPRPVAPDYVWGDALAVIDAFEPHARIINLEAAVTTSPTPWANKEIHYRTHPANCAVLLAARIDCCVLANNHVLDWGYAGLLETLDRLHDAGVVTAGAGRDLGEAEAPALVDSGEGRVVIIGIASTTSGTPVDWLAGADLPGVAVVDGWPADLAARVATSVQRVRQPGDVVVASIHWGSNWGYGVPEGQRRLAHDLIDIGGVDVVHGHSSHHPRPIELYRGRLILYGCGDLITDYEGITGHEEYRTDLVLAYLVTVDTMADETVSLSMAPFRVRRFRLETPSADDVAWLAWNVTRISGPYGVRLEPLASGALRARAAGLAKQ